PPISMPSATPVAIARAYPRMKTCRLLSVAARSWPERTSSMNAGTTSSGEGSSSLPAGIDARCHTPRKITNAMTRQPTMLTRPKALILEPAYAGRRFVARKKTELGLVRDHAADAPPQVRTPLQELRGGPEVVVPARAR